MTQMVCTADGSGSTDGGLVNPALLPAKSADLDTTLITGAADDIRAMGTTVDTQTDKIKTEWTTKLPGCYSAPEQATVYALMNDPATASETLRTTFNSMAGHLDTYAGELAKIKPDLADFEMYHKARGLRWPVIAGKETLWRYREGYDPYVKAGEKVKFYGKPDGRAAIIFCPYGNFG